MKKKIKGKAEKKVDEDNAGNWWRLKKSSRLKKQPKKLFFLFRVFFPFFPRKLILCVFCAPGGTAESETGSKSQPP